VGEGVVIDLGSHGLLFATLESPSALARGGLGSYNAALAPFPQERFRGEAREDMSENDKYAAYLNEVNRLVAISKPIFTRTLLDRKSLPHHELTL
jgi:hypothetical protein